MTRELAEEFYAEHRGKRFYEAELAVTIYLEWTSHKLIQGECMIIEEDSITRICNSLTWEY